MKENEMNKKTNNPDLSSEFIENNLLENNEEYLIPYEAACSHEYAEGCILREDD